MKPLTLVIVATLATGCAHRGATYLPMVDSRNVNHQALSADTQECQAYATQRPDAGSAAVVGAVLGAVLMAVVAGGGRSHNAGFWTAAGALSGGLGAANGAQDTQETIIRRCLAGRGYSVLN